MAEEIIQARVWTKVDTLENWNNNPLLLGPGEVALVTNPSGIPMNMKWGDKTTRKRFSDLPFAIAYDQGQFVAVSGTTLPASDGNVHYSLVGEGTYTRAGQSDVVVPVGKMGVIVDDGTTWSLGSEITVPLPTVVNNLDSDSEIYAGSANQLRILNIKDSLNNSVSADAMFFWAGGWHWTAIDNTKVSFARRTDIQQAKLGIYDTVKSQWIIKDIPKGSVIRDNSSNRSYRLNTDYSLTEIFRDYTLFTEKYLLLYPILTAIRDVKIQKKKTGDISELSVTLVSRNTQAGTAQIILNINDLMNGSLAAQSIVFNINFSDHSDLKNAIVTSDTSFGVVSLVVDLSILGNYPAFNAQTLAKDLWGRFSYLAIDSQYISGSLLNKVDNFSEFFVKNQFTGGINKDYAKFFKDMNFVYPYEPTVYKYFFRIIRKNYLNDGEANKYQIYLTRQPLADTGTTNAVTIASIIKGSIDQSGVETIELTRYSTDLDSKFYVTVDWNVLPDTYNGIFTSDNNLLNHFAFSGGNGLIKSNIRPKTFAEISTSRIDNYKLGTLFFKKSFFNAKTINEYDITPTNVDPIRTKLSNLRYLNLGANIRFLGCDANNTYWFNDSTDNSVSYCSSIEDVLSLNLTKLRTFTNLPVLCRLMNDDELLVVTKGSLSESKVAEIWVSSGQRTTWSMKMTFDNSNNETNVINVWGFSQYGDRVVLSGYGKRYTSNEPSADAPKYSDLSQRANYSIYYSPDNGKTWYNRLFNLGNQHPYCISNPQWKPYAHIHGVCIDPYWGELIITHGDLPTSDDSQGQQNRVFRSTNLKEWEKSVKDGSPITLQWTSSIEKKFVGVFASKDSFMFGSDDTPNGIYTASRSDKSILNTELMYTEPQWTYQRANGNPGTAGEYGVWGGYSFYQRDNNQPVYTTNIYVTGILPQDYKRCNLLATYNGYKYFKVWESDRDLVTASNQILTNTFLFVATDDNNNVLIQTKDSRFNPLVSGKPQQTDEYTLIIAKGI